MKIYYRMPKCSTCGTFGHSAGRNCPVHDLNLAQEKAASKGKITAKMLFPGHPELVLMLEAVQRSFSETLRGMRARA